MPSCRTGVFKYLWLAALALIVVSWTLAQKSARGESAVGSAPPKQSAGNPPAEDSSAKDSSAKDSSAKDSSAKDKAEQELRKFAKRPGRVLVIPIHDMIDLGLAPFVRRALAEASGASVVILDVNTFGGRVDAAVIIRDALLMAKVPTIAFVNHRAISAGALISLAADAIVFAPGGTMGAATPIQIEDGAAKPVSEKMVSYMRSEMRSTAQAKGRNGELAEAMVDADVEISGLSKKGKLLTLTTETAMETGVASATARSLDELLKITGLTNRPLSRAELSWGEKLTRFLTDSTVAGLLMSLGMLGLMIELYSPGFGLPGIVGITSLALFFGGHWFAALAGTEELVLALVGVGLLALEILVIPGFGWAGITGILCLATSLTMAMVGTSVGVAWQTGGLTRAIGIVLLALLGSVGAFTGILVALRRAGRLGQYSAGSWFVLNRTLAEATSARRDPSSAQPVPFAELMGRTGVALTDLRLSGKAQFDDTVYDVVSNLHYVNRGESVRVIELEGSRIVVTRNDTPNSS